MTKTENSAKNSLEQNPKRGNVLDNTGKKAVSQELWFNYFTEVLYSKGLIEKEQKARLFNEIQNKFKNN